MTNNLTQQHNEQPDELLISRCIEGDQVAYTLLYERYAPGIYRLCYGLTLNRQDAEDVMQDSFVYAFKSLSRFDSTKASFKTWLYTIAVSRSRNVFRRKRLPQVDFGDLFSWKVAAPKSDTPEAAAAHRAAQDELLNALSGLPAPLREATILRYAHGLTYREISEVMNTPQKTAESRVRLAHQRLHRLLKPVGRGLLEELVSF